MGVFSVLSSSYRALVDGTRELFVRVLMAVLIFLGYVLMSLFIYAVLRRIMVPQKEHVIPVHLQYNPQCVAGTEANCVFPQADILLNGGKKLLSSGQYYRVVLELVVPESGVNQGLGVFMANLTFYTTDHRYLSSSARPAMIQYKSPLLHTLYTLVFAIPLLFGFLAQRQTLTLVLYEAYYEPYGDGSLSATVSLLNHHVEVYSSRLTIEANFSGFTYYLYQWPVSMSVIVVVSIFITLCTCTIMMWVRDVVRDYDLQRRRGLQRRRIQQQQQQQHATTEEVASQDSAPSFQRGGRRRQQRQSHLQLVQNARAPASQPGPAPATPPDEREEGRATPTPSEVSTLAGVEDVSVSASDDLLTPSVISSYGGTGAGDDTGSEFSVGFNEVLSSLQGLRREIEGDEAEGGGASCSAPEEPGTLRKRT